VGIPQSRARLYLLLLNRCTLVRQLKASTANTPTLLTSAPGMWRNLCLRDLMTLDSLSLTEEGAYIFTPTVSAAPADRITRRNND
jgi:hypothetical protein